MIALTSFLRPLAFALLALNMAAATTEPAVVLGGLDPVLLVAGTEAQGNPAFCSMSGRFHYLFTSLENKQRFDARSADFAVQLDGHCAMGETMEGDPRKFAVYEGRIYLAASDMCLAAMKANPAVHLKARTLVPRRRVAILIFPGVQIVDYTGPYEVLGQAGYEVFTVAASTDPIVTNMGMTVTPAHSFQSSPAPDIIVLPGGDVPDSLAKTDPAIRWILERSPTAAVTLSVCNGAFWLANAGLLDGKEATTYYGLIRLLRTSFPNVKVVDDKRFCDNGNIITTAGLSSGIDGALHVVERLDGVGKARSVALNMEYNWQPDSGYARGGFADRHLRNAVNGRGRLPLPDGAKITVLDQNGTRDRWEEVWQVEGATVTPQSLSETASGIIPKTWKPAPTDAAGGKVWTFSDETGAPWSANVRVTADAAAKDRYILTLIIRRST